MRRNDPMILRFSNSSMQIRELVGDQDLTRIYDLASHLSWSQFQDWSWWNPWPCGPMDKASDYESGDSRFESWHGRKFWEYTNARIVRMEPFQSYNRIWFLVLIVEQLHRESSARWQGRVAQWIRHLTTNQGIPGSSPGMVETFLIWPFTGKCRDTHDQYDMRQNWHKRKNWPRWGSNPQSSDSKSDALSIGPRGR